MVTDGFTGNVALKIDGRARQHAGRRRCKTEYTRNPLRYFGALASWPVLRSLRREFDPRTYNGASMVGLTRRRDQESWQRRRRVVRQRHPRRR